MTIIDSEQHHHATVFAFWPDAPFFKEAIGKVLGRISFERVDGYDGKLRIVKVDVDESPDVARRYEIMSIPTLVVFHDGVAKKRMIGAKGKGQLVQELAEFL